MRAVSLSDARRGALYLRQNGRLDLHRAFGGDAQARLDPAGRRDPGAARRRARARPVACCPGRSTSWACRSPSTACRKGLLVIGDKESRQGVGPFSPGRPPDPRSARQPGGDRARERRPASPGAREGAPRARDRARLRDSAPDSAQGDARDPGLRARRLEPAGEAHRRRLLRLLPVRRAAAAGGWCWATSPGKGVPAALLVSTLHSALRLLLDRLELGSDLFSRLNDHILASSAANKFITLLAARLDTATGELHYLNAGHNPGDPRARAAAGSSRSGRAACRWGCCRA